MSKALLPVFICSSAPSLFALSSAACWSGRWPAYSARKTKVLRQFLVARVHLRTDLWERFKRPSPHKQSGNLHRKSAMARFWDMLRGLGPGLPQHLVKHLDWAKKPFLPQPLRQLQHKSAAISICTCTEKNFSWDFQLSWLSTDLNSTN